MITLRNACFLTALLSLIVAFALAVAMLWLPFKSELLPKICTTAFLTFIASGLAMAVLNDRTRTEATLRNAESKPSRAEQPPA